MLDQLSDEEPFDLSAVASSMSPMSLANVERECILQAIESADGNVLKAARLLELKRGAMRYRMKKYGIVAAAACS